ncbi:rCG37120, partial [Rattus norvegicus]
MDQSPSN